MKPLMTFRASANPRPAPHPIPHRTLVGIAAPRAQADAVGERLRVAGFGPDEASILFSDKSGQWASVADKAAGRAEANRAAEWPVGFGDVSSVGAGSLSGPIVATGPIRSVLGGTSVEDVVGALVDVGIPEHEARLCERRIRAGAILISVRTDDADKARRVRKILDSETRPGSAGTRG